MKKRDKFSVGQRVKSNQETRETGVIPVGTHGTITEARRWHRTIEGRWFGYHVTFDGIDPRRYKPDCTGFIVEEEVLDPLYDGNQTVAWSKCAWRPSTSAVVRQAALNPEIVEGLKATLRAFAKDKEMSISIFGAATLALIEKLEKGTASPTSRN